MVAVGGRQLLSELAGVHLRTVDRWIADGRMFDDFEADEYAARIARHPNEIWQGWFEVELEDEDEPWEQLSIFAHV